VKSIEELLVSKGIIPERPPSLDAKGHRIDIFPANVKGRFRTARNIVYTLLLLLFLVVPWTKFGGKQTIQLDLWNKEFTFFGTTLMAHEGPMVFFLFGVVVFALLLATAMYGRVWCGWACPQTVFIDGVFRRIEEWVEGNHIKRKKLADAPYNKEKIFKKSLKWFLFLVISSHIAHSIVAYFMGAQSLFWTSLEGPKGHGTLFIFVQIFTALIAVNFGWFKEQFCLVACPYGRLQSALMDKNTTTVIYDYKRGEPRRQNKDIPYADCVNCFKCVAVCPTGIDIRDGEQLECIGCTACIDACDNVMEKIGKPKGLIRYASEAEVADGRDHKKPFNTRALLYALGLLAMILSLAAFVYYRDDVSTQVFRATDSPYQISQSAQGAVVTNHFKINTVNQGSVGIDELKFTVDDPDVEIITPQLQSNLKPGEQNWMHVFLRLPFSKLKNGAYDLGWNLNYKSKNEKTIKGRLKIIGPDKIKGK